LKETNAQTIKEIFYKFLIVKRGHFSFMLKNNAKVFLGLVDLKNVKSRTTQRLKKQLKQIKHQNVIEPT
jgi:hypothetical protein